MIKIETLESMVMITQQEFSSSFRKMTFFFAHKNKHERKWFASISNLGNLYMYAENDSTISFSANIKIPMQTFKKPNKPDWEEVGRLSLRAARAAEVWSSWRMNFTDIQQMHMYNYGFEIRTNGPMEMLAIKNELVDILGNGESSGQEMPRIRESETSLEIVKSWSVDDDGFDAMIKAKQNVAHEVYIGPRIGQNRRKLTLD